RRERISFPSLQMLAVTISPGKKSVKTASCTYPVTLRRMCLLALSLCLPFLLAAQDADHDGLADSLEGELLARFAPTFMVSGRDCDLLPATFAPGEAVPRALARDGQIYGQVFPAIGAGLNGAFIEIHYYHLWSLDCG